MSSAVLFVVLAFSAFVTVHVVGSVALVRRRPNLNGAVALLVPPYFPVCAARLHATGWAVAWCAAATAYGAALLVATVWR
jgi:hypothetical protein